MVNIGALRQLSVLKQRDQEVDEKKTMRILQISFFLMAFFLAQTIFFEATVPFLVPLWAIVRLRYDNLKTPTLIGGLLGALLLNFGQFVIVCLQLLVFELVKRFRYYKLPTTLSVATAILIVQAVWQTISYSGPPPMLIQLYVFYEVALAFLMTLFLQVFLLPAHRFFTTEWTYERIGAGFVVLAAVIAGMQSVTISYVGLAPLFLHFLILVAAIVGGVPLATMTATITGTIIGVAKLSFTGMVALYALTGVAAGSCMKLGRVGVAAGSVVPSIFFFFYDATLPLDVVYFVSISIALVLFMLLKKQYLMDIRAFLYPKRDEVLMKRQQWLTDHTAQTVEQFQQFVGFMKELVYDRFTLQDTVPRKVEPFVTCSGCFRYERCWGEKNNDISNHIAEYYRAKTMSKQHAIVKAEELIKLKCVKSSKLLDELHIQLYQEQMNNQLFHGKKMIALQLRDVSNHLHELLEQMKEQTISFETQEAELSQALQRANVNCFQIDILNNQAGERLIVCSLLLKNYEEYETIQLCERIIMPIFYELYHEPFRIEKIAYKTKPFHYVEVRLHSAVRYEVEYDIYSQAKTKNVSGDAHALFPLHDGLMAMILSDGMGHNKKAQRESKQLIRLLRECLSYKMDPETAMHTMHYIMSLKRDADMYATIDFALLDLQDGAMWSWKAGGVATYILRGDTVLKIEGGTAPVGFMPAFSIETDKIKLLADDIIIMVSDGLFTSTHDWQEQEQCFLQQLQQKSKEKMPMDVLLYDVMAHYKRLYEIEDDCTVITCKIKHINPEWSVLQL